MDNIQKAAKTHDIEKCQSEYKELIKEAVKVHKYILLEILNISKEEADKKLLRPAQEIQDFCSGKEVKFPFQEGDTPTNSDHL